MTLLLVLLVLFLLHSAVSGILSRTPFTAPIVFTTAGALAHVIAPTAAAAERRGPLLLHVAELGLVLLLFTDGSRTDLDVLRHVRKLPGRLLSVGLLLTILLGGAAAMLVFPSLSLWEAGVLAAILAPTDAGLGQVVVTDPRVPAGVRQALNVEAGLNDGLSVPFLLFFLALATAGGAPGDASLMRFVVEQLGFGAILGAVVGFVGGSLLRAAHDRKWVGASWEPIGVVTLPLLCDVGSPPIGASMFIAAFVAGLVVRARHPDAGRHSTEIAEAWGQILNLTVFFLFGLLLAGSWESIGWAHVLYGVLSLTVIRMLPVAVALAGTGLSRATVLFMGWFGPRGLASIVLAMVYVEHGEGLAASPTVVLTVVATVAMSIYAHGLSASPGIRLLARESPARE